jgi:hypothetical protein
MDKALIGSRKQKAKAEASLFIFGPFSFLKAKQVTLPPLVFLNLQMTLLSPALASTFVVVVGIRMEPGTR